jgi:hypothetical protein
VKLNSIATLAVARRYGRPSFFLVLVILLSGCGTVKNADRILSDAVAGSTTLAAYYDDLAVITLDGWQNQGVYNAMLGIPAPSGEQYNERLQDFRQRADMAHTIVLVYQRLQTLHDPQGLAGVTNAGQDLGKAIKGVSVLPGVTNIPTDQLGSAAAALANLQRERDLKRALTTMAGLSRSLATMFAAEQHAYLSVQLDRTSTGVNLIPILAQKKLTNPGALLTGLHLGVNVTSASDEPGISGGLAMAKITAERAKLAWACATQNTAQVLNAIAGIGDSLNRGTTPDLASLEQGITHANTCLKEHDKLTGSDQ